MALVHLDFFSETLGLCCSTYIILPQATRSQIGMEGKAGIGPFKTLYLLHGLSDDHTIWLRRTSIERYVAPLNLAVVMPAANRSFYTDMASGPKYWTFVSEELPAICRAYFPLSNAREDTFAAGLSMGGYGAFKLGLGRPDLFAAAASLSGALNMARLAEAEEGDWRREMEGVFGPLDGIAGSPNDLFHLATQVARSNGEKPRLFQWCGTEDFLYEGNIAFRDHAVREGLDLTYSEGPGGHTWDMWDAQIERVLEWLDIAPEDARGTQ